MLRPPWRAGEVAYPVEQLRLVRVRGEAADGPDRAADCAILRVQADRARPRLEVGAQRAIARGADEQEHRIGIVDEVPQMLHPAPTRGHP